MPLRPKLALREPYIMGKGPPARPLIAVVGATGTGKSNVSVGKYAQVVIKPLNKFQLAVTLAERFNGEVVNADALQLYKGLPIVTNKITTQDMRGVPHHLLGRIGLNEEPWTVGHFATEATKLIESIRTKGKVPIIVGGTHYYLQSLIFKGQLVEDQGQDHSNPKDLAPSPRDTLGILDRPTEEILKVLMDVDPTMAMRWHPRDRRKIRRSLEIWLQTGRKASEIYAEQRHGDIVTEEAGNDPHIVVTRISPNLQMRAETLLFWIYAEREILDERLSNRVEDMLSEGLLVEAQQLKAFYTTQIQAGLPVDESRGIWVAIGYKEFREYFYAYDMAEGASNLLKLKAAAIEKTKIATRQYAKRQSRWIRLKLLPAFRAAGREDNAFLLDGTRTEAWSTEVEDKACEIMSNFMAGCDTPAPTSLSKAAAEILPQSHIEEPPIFQAMHCGVCDLTTLSLQQWQQHLLSRRHRKVVKQQRVEHARTHEE